MKAVRSPPHKAGIERLRFGLQDFGEDFGVVGLEQLRPGFADDLHVRIEVFDVGHELGGGVAAIGIIRRRGHPFGQAFGLGHLRRIGAADDGVVHALAGEAEGVRQPQFRISAERTRLGIGVQRQHAEIARHFMDGESAGRRFRVDQQFAAFGVDQFARDPRRFLRLAFRVADDHFDLPTGKAAGGVDLFHLHHHRIAR